MTGKILFSLNGRNVEAFEKETIWQVCSRLGIRIPHLCYRDATDYEGDGNCRACVVDVEGDRTLSASCIRQPENGMTVRTHSERAIKARAMVLELLASDQEEPEGDFKVWLDEMNVHASRFPGARERPTDPSHTAIAVDLNKCIHCKLCVQACHDIQGNNVIGMEGRGNESTIVFDMSDPMGSSTCVACGECVQVCPTNALSPSAQIPDEIKLSAEEIVNTVCPYCGVGCQLALHVKDNKIIHVDGRDGPANHGRLCVKGRFGLDYVSHPHRLTAPLIRKQGTPKTVGDIPDMNEVISGFREASWEEALDVVAAGFKEILETHGSSALAGFGSAKGSNEEAYLFQKLIRTGFKTNNVDHCTRLCHASSVAALLETIGSGAVTAPVINCLDSDVIMVIGANPTVNHPVAASFIKNAAEDGAELIVIDPRRNELEHFATHYLQFTPSSDVALLNAMLNVVIDEKLYDKQYVEAHIEGFDELCSSRKFIYARKDGANLWYRSR